MATDVHDLVMTERDSMSGDFTACCSCGWEGEGNDTQEQAIEDWENHCDVVFMEATGG